MGYELENIINFLQKHAENFMNYCERVESMCTKILLKNFNENILTSWIYLNERKALSNLPSKDRKQLTLKSVHSIRYLWLHKQNKNFNYFNLENENYLHVISQIFPVFKKADMFFRKIHESTIRNLSLDSKEFSLYSALIIFVGGLLN